MSDALKIKEVAKMLSISDSCVYKLINTGQLIAFKPGGGLTSPWRILREDLVKYIDQAKETCRVNVSMEVL